MLGLKLPTDPRWVNIAEKNIKEILIDHAFCEQKAASTAISFIVSYPEKSDLVQAMLDLAQEEIAHFKLVHKEILERGWVLGKERPDPYVRDLKKFFKKGVDKDQHLINKLLTAALIEARSCERFRVLSEHISDPGLAKFYRKLMVSEANHYTLFLTFARSFGEREKVDALWQDFLNYEAKIMANYGRKECIHG